jgi:GNAT superfamily N-acetyltransferase
VIEVPRLGQLLVAPAGNADRILKLRDDAATWLVSQGIRQWLPGEVTHDQLLARITSGSLFVARLAGDVIGTITVTWSDPLIWGTTNHPAGYIHNLVIDRRYAGVGLGLALLRWSEDLILSTGPELARLDCVRTNAKLRSYYERAGYKLVGFKGFDLPGAFDTALYEKSLVATASQFPLSATKPTSA